MLLSLISDVTGVERLINLEHVVYAEYREYSAIEDCELLLQVVGRESALIFRGQTAVHLRMLLGSKDT